MCVSIFHPRTKKMELNNYLCCLYASYDVWYFSLKADYGSLEEVIQGWNVKYDISLWKLIMVLLKKWFRGEMWNMIFLSESWLWLSGDSGSEVSVSFGHINME